MRAPDPPPDSPWLSPGLRIEPVREPNADSVLTLDHAWRITTAEGSFEGNLVGQVIWERFPDLVGGPLWLACRQAAQQRRPQRLAGREENDGRSAEIHVLPCPGGLLLLIRDTTRQQAAMAALRESNERLRAGYEAAPVGLALVDAELRHLAINERLARLSGGSATALMGRTAAEVVPGVARHVDPILREVLATGTAREGVLVAGRAGGAAARDLVAHYHPVHDAEGRVAGVSAAVIDLTPLRRTAAELKRALRAARAANAARSRMMTAVSREFRTPIAIIVGFAELLLRQAETPAVTPEHAAHLRDIAGAAYHLLALVDDVGAAAALAHPEEPGLRRGTVPLRRLAAEAAELALGPHGAAGLRLAGAGDPLLAGDPALLRRGLGGLLRESARHAPPGAIHWLSWAPAEDQLALHLDSPGPAADPAAAEAPRSGFESPGLGLQLALLIVEAHGGRLAAMEGPAGGTRWRMELPAAGAA